VTVERATVTVTGTQVPLAAPLFAAPEAPGAPAEPEAPGTPAEALAPEFPELPELPELAPPEADAEALMTVTYRVEVWVPKMVVVGPVEEAAPSFPLGTPAAPELEALVA
jgi:hypothetical protein